VCVFLYVVAQYCGEWDSREEMGEKKYSKEIGEGVLACGSDGVGVRFPFQ